MGAFTYDTSASPQKPQEGSGHPDAGAVEARYAGDEYIDTDPTPPVKYTNTTSGATSGWQAVTE